MGGNYSEHTALIEIDSYILWAHWWTSHALEPFSRGAL